MLGCLCRCVLSIDIPIPSDTTSGTGVGNKSFRVLLRGAADSGARFINKWEGIALKATSAGSQDEMAINTLSERAMNARIFAVVARGVRREGREVDTAKISLDPILLI